MILNKHNIYTVFSLKIKNQSWNGTMRYCSARESYAGKALITKQKNRRNYKYNDIQNHCQNTEIKRRMM